MPKRLLDVVLAAGGLLVFGPAILAAAALVWWGDRQSPWYCAPRCGRHGVPFRMAKLRSMRVGADRSGVSSTSGADPRVTPVGAFIRRYKLDELPQLWNVLKGEMSLVGPRPQVPSAVALYTPAEQGMLAVRPGITDFASIVFADEGAILHGSPDPDADYDRLIRPWKSRLALFYVAHASVKVDLFLVSATVQAVVRRPAALARVARWLDAFGADPALVDVAARRAPLQPASPP